MSSIPQTKDNGNSVSDFAIKFMKRFHIGRLFFRCKAGKEKGIPVMDIFKFHRDPAEGFYSQFCSSSAQIYAGGSGTAGNSRMRVFCVL